MHISISFFVLFMVSALRFDIGFDFSKYWFILTSENRVFQLVLGDRYETGNIILFNFSRWLKIPQIFFIVSSALIIYCIYKTLRSYSKDIIFSTLAFVTFPIFYFSSLSIIRQYIAVAILFYGLKYLIRRQNYMFIVLVFVASLFHISAYIGLILPLFFYKRWNNNLYFLILCLIISFFGSDVIGDLAIRILPPYYVKYYILEGIGTGGDKMLLLMQLTCFILLLIPSHKLETRFVQYINVFFVGVAIWGALAPYGHAGKRGALYFIIYFLLIVPELYQYFGRYRKILTFGLRSMTFPVLLITLVLSRNNPDKDPLIPYKMYKPGISKYYYND